MFYTTTGPHFQRSSSIAEIERCAAAKSGLVADDTSGVELELEWLENTVVLATEGHEMPQGQDASCTLGQDAQPADVPYQPDVPSVNNEFCQVPVRPRRERSEPL